MPSIQIASDTFGMLHSLFGVTVAAGATASNRVRIDASSDFEMRAISCSGALAGQAEPFPENILLPLTMMLMDSGSGRLFSPIDPVNPGNSDQDYSSQVPLQCFAGSGKLPFILPYPRIFKANSSIGILLRNFGVSTYNNIRIDFWGRKIFSLSITGPMQ